MLARFIHTNKLHRVTDKIIISSCLTKIVLQSTRENFNFSIESKYTKEEEVLRLSNVEWNFEINFQTQIKDHVRNEKLQSKNKK